MCNAGEYIRVYNQHNIMTQVDYKGELLDSSLYGGIVKKKRLVFNNIEVYYDDQNKIKVPQLNTVFSIDPQQAINNIRDETKKLGEKIITEFAKRQIDQKTFEKLTSGSLFLYIMGEKASIFSFNQQNIL
jgi:hypothetical protein